MSQTIARYARDHAARQGEPDPAQAARAAALLAQEGRRPVRSGVAPEFGRYVPAAPDNWWASVDGRWALVWIVALLALLALGALWVGVSLPDWGGALEGWGYVVEHARTGRLP